MTRVKRLAQGQSVTALLAAATVVVAAIKEEWVFAVIWLLGLAGMVVRARLGPPGELHPPSESTIQWLRKRRRG